MTRPQNSLRGWRKKQKLTQVEAAKRFGVSQGQWCKLEYGKRFVRDRVLLRHLLDVTGVPLEVLTGLE